jgi:acetyl esterase/lipase
MSRRRVFVAGLAVALAGIGSARSGPAEPVPSGGGYDVRVVPNLPYYEGKDADPRKHRLDVYLPKGAKDFPVVLFVHGGGWASGDRKLYAGVGRVFARNGVGTVVISYRLSPSVKHPGHIEDVARAFAWTHQNIARYGGRPDRIFVTGQSAGGHLAALLATNETYLKAHGLSSRDIRGVMPMSGVYVFRGRGLRGVLGDAPEARADASPLEHVSGREPPFLIVYADNDFPGCALMSKAFATALREKKVAADLYEVKDRNHISIIFRLMLDEADPATQALLKFVARHSGLKLAPADGGETPKREKASE